ncbi:MAG: hypothetical protein Fur0022_35290 [Anaerolineales bacterium]
MGKRLPAMFGLLALPLLFFLFFGNQFLYLSGAEFSDLTVSHLPNTLYLRRSLLEWGQVPLWGNGILSGYPFVANPLSGLFYPPGWLAVLRPTAWMFNLLAGLHLVWGGVGMALFLKKLGLREVSAVFGGLAFSFMPKLFAHYGAGHMTLIYAISWTPWLLLFASRRLSSSFFFSPAFVFALIFFADVRWAAFAGVLWVGYACSQINLRDGTTHATSRQESPAPETALSPPSKKFAFLRVPLRSIFLCLGQMLVAAALTAPLSLPFLEFVRLSTRAILDAEDVLAFSLPPARLLGFLFPEMGGNPEWVIYPGMMTFALALIGLFWSTVRQRTRFWWTVWLISMLYSFGENIPGLTLLAEIPGFSLLRVPPRAMFLAGMALAMLAAFTLNHLLEGGSAADRRRGRRVLVILFGITTMLAIGVRVLTGEMPLNFFWGAGMAGLVFLTGVSLLRSSRPAPVWVGLVVVGISLADGWGVNVRSLSPRSVQEIDSEQAAVVQFLADQPGFFRIYSPSYSLPQHMAARYGLELADGVDPMQLQSYVTFMETATGVPQTGYSVTMPPFAGDIRTANAAFVPNVQALGRLNVRYLVAEFDLRAEGLVLIKTFENTRVYENTHFQSRAWMQEGETVSTFNLLWTPNRIELDAVGPGLLVLSEIAYPGWQVHVDGQPAELIIVEDLLRGVHLPVGSHEVVFTFRPASVYVGWSIFGITLISAVLIQWFFSKTNLL